MCSGSLFFSLSPNPFLSLGFEVAGGMPFLVVDFCFRGQDAVKDWHPLERTGRLRGRYIMHGIFD
jgi:hypothetical protein